ncbi:helix-turn-helix transcriptional regulator [Tepidibacter sp. Z1-5]|uniref:helix-turn-helix transcriptional regulator n=1 Tax=Tepidibacter sp. Z1-5 TaxID=3134138 RepID=UPI0030BE747D
MCEIYKKLATTVKVHRNTKQYSTATLAKKINTSVGLINNLENARHDIFKLDLFNALITELHIPLDQVFTFQKLDLNPIYCENNILQIQQPKDQSGKAIENINHNLNLIISSFVSLSQEYNHSEQAMYSITKNIVSNIETMRNLNNLKYQQPESSLT